jgi:hypothetical protein
VTSLDRNQSWVVIETNVYAGNFNRELTAWCTGACGETHGQYEADEFVKRVKGKDAKLTRMQARIDYVDDGCERSTIVAPSVDAPHTTVTGVSIPFAGGPRPEDLRFILKRAVDYAEKVRSGYFNDKPGCSMYADKNLRILGVHVRRRVTVIDEDSRIVAPKSKVSTRAR